MAYLSDKTLFNRTLPAEWQPLLELLHELDLLGRDQQSQQQRRATRLEAQMIQHAATLNEELPQSLRSSSPEYRRRFTEAALLWPLFADVGAPVLVNTMGSTTLEKYDIDFPAASDRGVLRRALARTFGWTPAELDSIESKIHELTGTLRIKKALARHLSKIFDDSSIEVRQRKAVQLMCRLQGSIPWRPGDVDVVISGAAMFMCICYEGTSLTHPDYAERPERERTQISTFLKRVHAEQNSLKNIRFPAFGFFDTNLIAPDLLAELTGALRTQAELGDIHERQVVQALATMVTILPTSEADKYLVHDVWGHGWQEALCEFEWTYQDLATISESLHANRLIDAFETKDGRAILNSETLLRTIEADLRHRILVGLNLIMSELLADIIEYKYSRHLAPLPSSSIFPDGPLRLDLSLKDTRQMIHAWRRPYRRVLLDATERERLRHALVSEGVVDRGLMDSLEQAASLINSRFASAFEDETSIAVDDSSGARANLLQRIMLSIISIDAALEQFLADAEARYRDMKAEDASTHRWQCPAACIDFIVLLLGWFYEQERELYVWHLDEFVLRELGPGMAAFEEALRKESRQLRKS